MLAVQPLRKNGRKNLASLRIERYRDSLVQTYLIPSLLKTTTIKLDQ